MHKANLALSPSVEQSLFSAFVNLFQSSIDDWRMLMRLSPNSFELVEKQIVDLFMRFAGLMLMAVMSSQELQQALNDAAPEYVKTLSGKWRFVAKRTVKVTIFNGMKLEILCHYYVPRKRKGNGRKRKGIYPELILLGIYERASPRVQSEVARLVALLPSMKIARDELAARGLDLNIKSVRKITYEVGERALCARSEELEKWRNGELEMGNELKGKRVVVSIDGGKGRTRKNKRGPKTKKGRSRYHTKWKEPRLLIIYTVDDRGKRDRSFQSFVDGGLLDKNECMELLAFHLYRLGAAKAQCVHFVSDGAEWIWNRIQTVMSKACIPEEKVTCLLDFYHGSEQIGKALKEIKSLSEKERRRIYKKLRKLLLRGKVNQAMETLNAIECPENQREAIRSCLNYFANHAVSHMQYNHATKNRLPLGSGAVESAIRRVINLRIKSPGIFWKEEHMEMVVYLRAQFLTGRWNEMIQSIRAFPAKAFLQDWRLQPVDMRNAAQDNAQNHGFSILEAKAA